MTDLYHYYDNSTGPFRNLSDLPVSEAEAVLLAIRRSNKGFASQRTPDYFEIRRGLESEAREMFIRKGGKPVRAYPHYLTLGECPWLLGWYPHGKQLRISVDIFDPDTLSFTYGDLFPTMRVRDGKRYRGMLYTLDEIGRLVEELGLPQEWNPDGLRGPERYIEVQVWDDKPLSEFIKS